MYTINIDNIVKSLEKMANDIQYPPLNGGPTKDDILAMLRGASAIIAEQESYIDDQDEATDRVKELESAVEEAAKKLDNIDLTLAQASGELGESKALEAIQGAIMEVRSDLRRA